MSLRDLVFAALFNALKNGAFSEGGPLFCATSEAVAIDLMDCDADIEMFEGVALDEVRRYVVEWKAGAPA